MDDQATNRLESILVLARDITPEDLSPHTNPAGIIATRAAILKRIEQLARVSQLPARQFLLDSQYIATMTEDRQRTASSHPYISRKTYPDHSIIFISRSPGDIGNTEEAGFHDILRTNSIEEETHAISLCMESHFLLPNKATSFDSEWEAAAAGKDEDRGTLIHCVSISNGKTTMVWRPLPDSILPDSLIRYLREPSFIKFGAGIATDADRIFKKWGIKVTGTHDISVLGTELFPGHWTHRASKGECVSLTDLCARYLGYRLEKNAQQANWASSARYSQLMIDYSAHDALSGVKLAHYYREQLAGPRNVSSRPLVAYYRDQLPWLFLEVDNPSDLEESNA